mgnify:CR=1 FL=1
MNKVLLILSVFLFTVILFLIDDYTIIGEVYFYILTFLCVRDFIKRKTITLFNIWNGAFIFIILSEVFIPTYEKGDSNTITALIFIITANNIVNLGYFLTKIVYVKQRVNKLELLKNIKTGNILIYGLILIYVFYSGEVAINRFLLGRSNINTNDNVIYLSFISSLGLLLPSIIAFYFTVKRKKSVMSSVFLSLPIFILLFFGGSRFPLLFSFFSFLLVILGKEFYKLEYKTLLKLSFAVLLLLFSSSIMKNFRTFGFNNQYDFSTNTDVVAKPSLAFIASSYMSPEGVIDMTSLMFKYFSVNDHMYGKSSSFLLYFWIPRSLWKEKPTMLGHWFIRKHRSGFSDGHSTSFGFVGDLYADFGLFSLFFVYFIGRLLRWAEVKKDNLLKGDSSLRIIGAMIFPYCFFFVRSPITSTMNFLGILLMYFIIKRFLFKTYING